MRAFDTSFAKHQLAGNEHLIEALDAVATAFTKFPALTPDGCSGAWEVRTPTYPCLVPADHGGWVTTGAFFQSRRVLALPEIATAISYLRSRRKGKLRLPSSYLTDCATGWGKVMTKDHVPSVSNGALIAAALHLGIRIKKSDGPDVLVAVSDRHFLAPRRRWVR